MKMKTILTMVFGGCAMTVAATRPAIDPSSISITGGDGYFASEIKYTLTGVPAIVTIDIQTNTLPNAAGEWVSIGGKAMGELGGEANKTVYEVGKPVSAYWWPGRDWTGNSVDAGNLRAIVTAWPTNEPPDYMVVSLSGLQTNVPRFYISESALPGGLHENSEYKNTKVVMRKIPAKNVIWRMGAADGDQRISEQKSEQEIAHRVRLSSDYYISVFEMTQGQYQTITGSNPSSNKNLQDSYCHPVECVKFSLIRGRAYTNETSYAHCWPENGHSVSADSAIGKLRKLAQMPLIDLPTDAQWEYACRAGTGSMFANGATTEGEAKRIANVSTQKSQPVGTLGANLWGVYDMHGNVAEFVLDNCSTGAVYAASFDSAYATGGVTDDPQGVSTAESTRSLPGTEVIKRGGSFLHHWLWGRSATRMGGSHEYASKYIGFRVVCPVTGEMK